MGDSYIQLDAWAMYAMPFPLVLLSPFTAGLTFVTRNYAREEHAFVWSDFWENVKGNWKYFLLNGFIVYVVYVVLSFSAIYYYNGTTRSWFFYIPFWLCLVLALFFLFAQYYLPDVYKRQATYLETDKEGRGATMKKVKAFLLSLGVAGVMSAAILAVAAAVIAKSGNLPQGPALTVLVTATVCIGVFSGGLSAALFSGEKGALLGGACGDVYKRQVAGRLLFLSYFPGQLHILKQTKRGEVPP